MNLNLDCSSRSGPAGSSAPFPHLSSTGVIRNFLENPQQVKEGGKESAK